MSEAENLPLHTPVCVLMPLLEGMHEFGTCTHPLHEGSHCKSLSAHQPLSHILVQSQGPEVISK